MKGRFIYRQIVPEAQLYHSLGRYSAQLWDMRQHEEEEEEEDEEMDRLHSTYNIRSDRSVNLQRSSKFQVDDAGTSDDVTTRVCAGSGSLTLEVTHLH